ncbi:MAG: YerC/YecD family TrpR-related protein [Patescibacteria group bacterium]|nr:YerC/YecD family TrpR-related protein [Patescibacteria group bacterium]
MPKYKASKLHPSDHQQLLREFFTAIANLRTVEEVANFFQDLLSVTETTMLARRLKVAQRLEAGKTYDAIAEDLDISKTTIARVQRWLEHGNNGYHVALERLADVNRRGKR